MPEQTLDAFHFLRPAWLLLVPLTLWLHWQLRRVVSASDQWRGIIDEALLSKLIVGKRDQKWRFRPYQLLSAVLLLTSLALAGPAWERELTPFTEDTSPLVIALELTDSMYGIDQPPTRLARATQKIQDLLTMRRGARTAVVAYAGTAHAVLPLTDDTELIQIYLASLSRDIMPLAGDRPDRALALALDMLSKETAVGTIVFVTDGIDAGHRDTFAAAFDRSRDQLLVLALGSDVGGPVADGGGSAPPVDMGGLNSIVDAAGGWLARATVDESDVEALNRRVNRHLVNAIEGDEELRWRDAGYVLVWPLALLVLAWFRRGWTVQWC